ncbi:MAG: SdrD B-like domain-containing protein [Blautia sp.]|jgi:uncharacterized repeat protein (TIGR01451 family)
MATISGRVVFDRDRSATINSGDTGISGIPVVLQNVSNGLRLVVVTDANGNYSFLNVPNGSYRIVESYGTTGGISSPGDFTNAVVGEIPVGMDPPVSAVTNPPSGTTNIDSLTPDTLLVTVSGANLDNQNFLDGPVIYSPIANILDPCAVISGSNLITAADNGTFGTFPPGTPANTGVPEEPYPGVAPDFTYVLPNPEVYAPFGGEYTVQNIMTNSLSASIGAWWRIADHTFGNETGRMMIVNGFNPGAVFFRDTVTVRPDTNYLFTAWILNLFKVTGYPNPELGVRILDAAGNVIYSATLGILIPVNTNAPEWKQIGSVINSRNNTSLTVEFLSEGPEVIGNDYAIDDISLNEILVPQFVPVKSVSQSSVSLGETVQYTVRLENTCTQPLTDVFFRDVVPEGLTFVPGSVIVDGTLVPGANPEQGFSLPDILGGETAEVTFSVRADQIPVQNPILNSADITYSYTPVEGGIPLVNEVTSNEVAVSVETEADVSVVKTANPSAVLPGGVLEYRITVTNAGPSQAENVRLTDMIPAQITGAEFSVNGGVSFMPWTGSLSLGTMAAEETRVILIRGTVSPESIASIRNTASVESDTPDPNPGNNTDTAIVGILTSRCQAYVDVIESIALQQTALARILNAEGMKMQTFIDMEGITAEGLLVLNENVRSLVGSAANLEMVLQNKLKLVSRSLEECGVEDI